MTHPQNPRRHPDPPNAAQGAAPSAPIEILPPLSADERSDWPPRNRGARSAFAAQYRIFEITPLRLGLVGVGFAIVFAMLLLFFFSALIVIAPVVLAGAALAYLGRKLRG